jgi:hypothetical protein
MNTISIVMMFFLAHTSLRDHQIGHFRQVLKSSVFYCGFKYIEFGSTAPGKSEEDELYEAYISEINKVYKLIGCEKLVEMEDYSGDILKYEMLRNKEVSSSNRNHYKRQVIKLLVVLIGAINLARHCL